MSTIPVICDRCRSVGNSGEGDFSHLGDLLDFAPVKRRKRLNGWDEDAQRAFIAALAMTGSKTAAAKSLGRNGFGIDQLLKSEGSESFRLAYDRAIAIAEKNGAMRLATGVADAAARNKWLDKRSALRGIEPEEEPTMSDDHKWELVQAIGTKFLRKVAAEREARLAGEIVAADFYLRQITFMEVMFELTVANLGFDPHETLSQLRRGDHRHNAIVSTPFSDWLDASRRKWWAEEGEPERPKHPDASFLIRHRSDEGEYSTYGDVSAYGAHTIPARGYTKEAWAEMEVEEQKLVRQKQFAEDAEEQRQWEARARAEFEARQEPNAAHPADDRTGS